MNLINTFLEKQHLIFLVNSSIFLEIPISGGVMFQILDPRYLKHFRPLLTVLIGPVVKFARHQKLYFVVRIIHS